MLYSTLMSIYRSNPLFALLLSCAASSVLASSEGSGCSADTGKTECPSLLQTTSATVAKRMAEQLEEEGEDEDEVEEEMEEESASEQVEAVEDVDALGSEFSKPSTRVDALSSTVAEAIAAAKDAKNIASDAKASETELAKEIDVMKKRLGKLEEGNKQDMMRSDDQDLRGGMPLTCSQEEIIRTKLMTEMKVKGKRTARIIRAVFHDAIDENNLLVKNKETGIWEPAEGNYGGVDDCLYSPLTQGDKGHPEPTHNKNLGGISVEYMKLCTRLCKSARFANTTLCDKSKNRCEVDLRVLGALVTIETAGGPRIPMTWGRKKGKCGNMIVSEGKTAPEPALRFAPSLTGLDDADSFRTAFDRLGFSPKDQAALMGAHTFGKLAVCAGGLNGIEKGNFCNDHAKLDPPLKLSNFAPWSKPQGGPCIPVYGKIGGGVSNGCWAKAPGGDLAPVFARSWMNRSTTYAGMKYGRGLGDGGFFDTTPDTFDNDYYKLFADDTFGGKDVCCGKMKKGECDRAKGSPARITKRNAAGRGMQAELVKGGECAISWCRDDRKDKTHMKSTRAWAEAPHDFVKKGAKFGVTKRIIRLAGDWALLGNDLTHASVKLFAKDQSAFFEAFKVAFTKVMNKGYKNLVHCSDDNQKQADKSDKLREEDNQKQADKPDKLRAADKGNSERKGKGPR